MMIHSKQINNICFRQSQHITSKSALIQSSGTKQTTYTPRRSITKQLSFPTAKRMSRKLSGIQKEVLALYRTLLREATKKDRAANTTTTTTDFKQLSFTRLLFADASTSTSTAHARNEFRRQALKGSRKDYNGIEHKIRHGYKQIKLLQMPGVVTFKSW